MSEKVTQNKNEVIYTETEAAKKIKVSTLTLYRARKEKRLEFYQIGRRILFAEKHLQDFLMSCEQKATEVNA